MWLNDRSEEFLDSSEHNGKVLSSYAFKVETGQSIVLLSGKDGKKDSWSFPV